MHSASRFRVQGLGRVSKVLRLEFKFAVCACVCVYERSTWGSQICV